MNFLADLGYHIRTRKAVLKVYNVCVDGVLMCLKVSICMYVYIVLVCLYIACIHMFALLRLLVQHGGEW